jgi:methionyl-tRNA formyltransferase
MKIALLMKHNSYYGREYLTSLMSSNIKVDVIYYGNFPTFNKLEDKRCGGLWCPMNFTKLQNYFNCYHFESMDSKSLGSLLSDKNYDLGIQGGVGILSGDIIERFYYGIINIHPGDLPFYRGCSAPEWQVIEGNPIISTCHILDEGIDTGLIYSKKKIDVDIGDYHKMRSQIYPKQAEYLIEILDSIGSLQDFKKKLTPQDEGKSCYRNYIGDDMINQMKRKMPTQ